MKNALYAGAMFSIFAAIFMAPAAFGADAAPANSGCDQWGLSGKDLTDCRTQWAAAKSDAERDRVKAMYISPAFINSTTPNAATGRGSSTPPDNLSGPAGSAPQAPPSPAGTPSSVAKPGISTPPSRAPVGGAPPSP